MRSLLTLLCLSTLAFGQSKTVYLTFDDGPKAATKDVLDTLASLSVKATFFVVGSNQEAAGGKDQQRELFRRIRNDGHKVGNHTFTHKPMAEADYLKQYPKPLTDAAKKAFQMNFDDNQAHFRNLLPVPETVTFKLARLAGDGGVQPSLEYLRNETQALGMKHVTWTFEIAPNDVFKWVPHNDWQGITGVAASNVTLPPDNAIILFHDEHWGNVNAALLKKVIQYLSGKGYSFALVSD